MSLIRFKSANTYAEVKKSVGTYILGEGEFAANNPLYIHYAKCTFLDADARSTC
jgi:hypothetical protein